MCGKQIPVTWQAVYNLKTSSYKTVLSLFNLDNVVVTTFPAMISVTAFCFTSVITVSTYVGSLAAILTAGLSTKGVSSASDLRGTTMATAPVYASRIRHNYGATIFLLEDTLPDGNRGAIVQERAKGYLEDGTISAFVDDMVTLITSNNAAADRCIAFHTYFDADVISNSLDPGILILQESDGFGLLYNKELSLPAGMQVGGVFIILASVIAFAVTITLLRLLLRIFRAYRLYRSTPTPILPVSPPSTAPTTLDSDSDLKGSLTTSTSSTLTIIRPRYQLQEPSQQPYSSEAFKGPFATTTVRQALSQALIHVFLRAGNSSTHDSCPCTETRLPGPNADPARACLVKCDPLPNGAGGNGGLGKVGDIMLSPFTHASPFKVPLASLTGGVSPSLPSGYGHAQPSMGGLPNGGVLYGPGLDRSHPHHHPLAELHSSPSLRRERFRTSGGSGAPTASSNKLGGLIGIGSIDRTALASAFKQVFRTQPSLGRFDLGGHTASAGGAAAAPPGQWGNEQHLPPTSSSMLGRTTSGTHHGLQHQHHSQPHLDVQHYHHCPALASASSAQFTDLTRLSRYEVERDVSSLDGPAMSLSPTPSHPLERTTDRSSSGLASVQSPSRPRL
ncbi:MAG: hypothetical protein WDW38_008890 [Sanguina aurantia]